MDKNGVAKLSGRHPDYEVAVSASSQVVFDGHGAYAIFYPLAKINVCGISDSGNTTCRKEQTAIPIKMYFE